MKCFTCLFATVLGIVTASASESEAEASASRGVALRELADLIRQYSSDRSQVSRFYDLPWSEARADRMETLSREWQTRLDKLPFQNLSLTGRVDYILLRNEIASRRANLELEQQRLGEMEELLAFRSRIHQLERSRWRMEPVAPEKAATTINELAEQVRKLRERVEKGNKRSDGKKTGSAETNAPSVAAAGSSVSEIKVTPLIAKRTASALNDLRGTLKTWYNFYDGYQPDFGWWVKKPYDEAASLLEGFAKYLREEIAGLKGKDEDPLIGEPIGRNALEKNILHEFLPYSPEELIAIGEREFAWCEGEMKKAAREMKQDDWKQALAEVKSRFVPPGQQIELVSQFAREATEFVKSRDLVTVPPLCEELWRLNMISPEGQKSLPYVAYGGLSMLVAYAKDEMKHEDKLMAMRGNNRHFTRITTAHELIPGHHLQIFTADRHRTYRSIFSTPFFTEGWPLYWEFRLWDLGYGQTPEDRIGMLFWRMHRAARIIVSLKFHLGRMEPKEMVDFLVDRVGHERLGATSEVRRYIGGSYSPLYQCGYMIGGLQLQSLHRELVESGRWKEKAFHDAVLSMNSIPIELVRANLMNQPPTRDARPTWRFADGLLNGQ